MPYWELALRRSPPSTLTTQTHPSGKSYMRYEEVFNGAGGTGVGRLNHVSLHFVLYLRDWTVYSAVNVHVSHDHMRPQPASIQIPLSVFMSLCVSGTSGHSPWSAWSRVGGGGLWQRPRPGWFPGQVHMHSSCLLCAYVESCIVTFHLSTFMTSLKKYFFSTLLKHINSYS